MSDDVPDLLLEQLALDELDDEQAQALKDALGDRLESELNARRQDDQQTLQRHPPARIAAQIEARINVQAEAEASASQPSKRAATWPMWTIAGAVGAVAVAALVLVWNTNPPQTSPAIEGDRIAQAAPSDTVRIKGDPHIVLQRSRKGGGADPLAAGDTVKPGDLLLVALRPANAVHGVLVSVDGAGEVTLHFPTTPEEHSALPLGAEATLHGFELDDAPGFERFLFVTADSPLDVAGLVQATRTLGAQGNAREAKLPVPDGARVTELLLERDADF